MVLEPIGERIKETIGGGLELLLDGLVEGTGDDVRAFALEIAEQATSISEDEDALELAQEVSEQAVALLELKRLQLVNEAAALRAAIRSYLFGALTMAANLAA